jgi:hypothetical protein
VTRSRLGVPLASSVPIATPHGTNPHKPPRTPAVGRERAGQVRREREVGSPIW